ncbi:hypothetical protein M3589_06955 [Heyndrickxia oleronia]|uniref:hypothetical protein n=1 Tax=Heyndrickxia oleronia TaxID=38875 RepID=UPI0020421FB7|nr:hypothetical protein [Heyndrickxia oleronia]MCM3237461.1 hypothetical protein [Heyndrickxia oleronia]
MSSLYEKPLFKNRAKELAITTFTRNIRKSLFRQVVKLIPGAGSIAGAGIAGSMTLGLGDAIKYFLGKSVFSFCNNANTHVLDCLYYLTIPAVYKLILYIFL